MINGSDQRFFGD